jgi:hypothetical protein
MYPCSESGKIPENCKPRERSEGKEKRQIIAHGRQKKNI